MKKIFFLVVVSIFILLPKISTATSGACSYHGGVDCDRGWQVDGNVYCVDGWEDSNTFFDFTVKCQQSDLSPVCIEYIKGKDEYLKEINKMIDDKLSEQAYTDTSDPHDAKRSQNYFNYLYALRDGQLQRYYEMAKNCTDDINKLKYNYTTQLKKVEDPNTTCQSHYGANSHYTGNKNATGGYICDCKSGYKFNDSKTSCMVVEDRDAGCKNKFGLNSYWTGEKYICDCSNGYEWQLNLCVKVGSTLNLTALPQETLNNKSVFFLKSVDDLLGNIPARRIENSRDSCVEINAYLDADGSCKCLSGYGYSETRKLCVKKIIISEVLSTPQQTIKQDTPKKQNIQKQITNEVKLGKPPTLIIQSAKEQEQKVAEKITISSTDTPAKQKSIVGAVFSKVGGWFLKLFR